MALSKWVVPIAYCEIDSYCQSVLLSRISDGSLNNAPIWDDIKSLSYDGRNWPEVDIIYGGFPCQDISVAGRGAGLDGQRSGLFFEIMRLAKEIKPKFIFLENVPAITSRGGLRVVREVAEMGYDCRWCVISAASVGALHRRERWFLLANSTSQGTDRYPVGEKATYSLSGISGENVADTQSQQSGRLFIEESQPDSFDGCYRRRETNWWEIEPDVGRVADGIPFRVDRLRALGNSVVARQAKEAFKILMGLK